MKNKTLQPPITSKPNIGHHTNKHILNTVEPLSTSVKKKNFQFHPRKDFLNFFTISYKLVKEGKCVKGFSHKYFLL